jgi:hypothetical protein
MYLRNGRINGNSVYPWKRTTSWVMWPVGPKLVFDQMTASVPEIMDSNSRIYQISVSAPKYIILLLLHMRAVDRISWSCIVII